MRLEKSSRGATRLGLVDVLVALIVLAILLFASWKQFPAYERTSNNRTPTSTTVAPVKMSKQTPASQR